MGRGGSGSAGSGFDGSGSLGLGSPGFGSDGSGLDGSGVGSLGSDSLAGLVAAPGREPTVAEPIDRDETAGLAGAAASESVAGRPP
jgi:hypothetical protein